MSKVVEGTKMMKSKKEFNYEDWRLDAIKDIKILSTPRPHSHGSCCTCQGCGLANEDCDCNERWAVVKYLKEKFNLREKDLCTKVE